MKEENCSKEERFSFEMVWVIPKLREAQVFISISENSKETPYTFFCKFGDGQKLQKSEIFWKAFLTIQNWLLRTFKVFQGNAMLSQFCSKHTKGILRKERTSNFIANPRKPFKVHWKRVQEAVFISHSKQSIIEKISKLRHMSYWF